VVNGHALYWVIFIRYAGVIRYTGVIHCTGSYGILGVTRYAGVICYLGSYGTLGSSDMDLQSRYFVNNSARVPSIRRGGEQVDICVHVGWEGDRESVFVSVFFNQVKDFFLCLRKQVEDLVQQNIS
jgi:hypothetical protein